MTFAQWFFGFILLTCLVNAPTIWRIQKQNKYALPIIVLILCFAVALNFFKF